MSQPGHASATATMHERLHASHASRSRAPSADDHATHRGAHSHVPGRVSRVLSSLLSSLVSVTVAITMVTVTILGLIVVLLMRGPGAGAGLLSNPTGSIIETTSVIFGPRPPAPSPPPRVALLFFGLTRSLKYTLPSIESNVVGPLREAGVQTDVFLHTYNDTDDAQSKGTDTTEWRMLHPSKYIITSQQTFIDKTHSKRDACWKVGTGWVHEPAQQQQRNVLNLLCQLNSLREVADLWHRHAAAAGLQYRSVIFLRPDVLYMDPLPVESILSIKEGTVSVPDWAHYKGMNDRFAALGPLSAAIWKERLMFTMQKCREKPLHSEAFTFDFAMENNLQVNLLENFEFFRIRSTGDIPKGDDRLPGYEQAQELLRQRHEELVMQANAALLP
eukprot:jgi/Ulvmu1/12814/UM097_0043.1